MRRFGTRPCFWFVLSLAVCALVLGGCAEQAPQDYLNEPLGEQAQEADALWDIAFPIAVGIFFVVEGLLVYALIRFRHKPGREAAEFHGNTRLEVALTVIPALILGGVSIPTLRTLFNITSTPTGANVVEATVIGHQFWWEYRYTDVPGVPEISEEDPLVTANELHIPTGTPVRLKLIGAPDDVIHSFWPPKIAGKQDVVPGRENQVTLETNVEGRYWGQCGEYCGESHANMSLRVFAQSPEEFQAWARAQEAPAETVDTGLATQGQQLFFNGSQNGAFPRGPACATCHTVEGVEVAGVEARGVIGPNLTHFDSRQTFAAATFVNNDENLRRWLDNPPLQKPGVLMPDVGLTSEQITAVVAYLRTLD